MLLLRVLKTPGSRNGFSMDTLRQLANRNENVRRVLGPHWQEVVNPTDKMAIDEVKSIMNPGLIEILLESEDKGEMHPSDDRCRTH